MSQITARYPHNQPPVAQVSLAIWQGLGSLRNECTYVSGLLEGSSNECSHTLVTERSEAVVMSSSHGKKLS